MKEAESTPSPNRFWRKLGIFIATASAAAWGEVPRKCEEAPRRTKPNSLEARMPAATSSAPRPPRSAVSLATDILGPWSARLPRQGQKKSPELSYGALL